MESHQSRIHRARLTENVKELVADGQGLERVLHFIRDNTGINLDIRWSSLMNAGVDKTTAVSVSLHDVPLGKVLRTVLSATHATIPIDYVFDDGVITISTRDDLISLTNAGGNSYTSLHNTAGVVSDEPPDALYEALTTLKSELQNYIDENTTGSGMAGVWPPITKGGHSIHHAVVAAETFYPNNKLPSDGRLKWAELLRLSRRGITTSTYDTGYAALALQQWADREIDSLGQLSSEGFEDFIMKKEPPKVFICYAKQDVAKAGELFDFLLRAGASPWMDKKKLILGDDWESEIKKAVAAADAFITLLRPGFDEIGFRQREVHWAIEAHQLRPPGKGFIIPFIVEPCTLPEWCKPIHAGSNLSQPTLFDDVKAAIEKHAGVILRV